MVSELQDILRCPTCSGRLHEIDSGFRCRKCSVDYPIENNQVDLRIKKDTSKTVEFEFDGHYPDPAQWDYEIPRVTSPEIDWSDEDVAWHLDKKLLSHFPSASSSEMLAIDVGCGEGTHKQVCEKAGFTWIGIDPKSETAPILGDGHSLPFEDSTFDFSLSMAVLEHVSNPIVMLKEISRVLKPGRKFIGSVAFLEPFHEYSYYHHSPLAVIQSLQEADFSVQAVGPGWHALTAIGRALFPKLPDFMVTAATLPVQLLHKFWYRVGGLLIDDYLASEHYRRIAMAGSFRFIATNNKQD